MTGVARCGDMDLMTLTDEELARQRVRTIVTARWVGVAFGLFQVIFYRTVPYPDGVQEVAFGLVGLMALSNAVFEVLQRRVRTSQGVTRLALAVLASDVLIVSGVTWVYAFDAVSVIFAVLFLLPIEGAVLFGLPGAAWTWGAVAALYTGREWFSTRYGLPFEFESVTFRMGLVGIVALIVGFLVRDLVRARMETDEALQVARHANESRSRLISMLAHDVRAPIAGVRSAVSTIRNAGERIDAEQRDRLLAAGGRQADRALFIAADLLDLARVETGTLSVEPRQTPLVPMLDRIRDVLGDRIDPEIDVGDLTVWADPARLEQVLYNLLDNAAKYGEPPVEVHAEPDGDEVAITVRDHGPGVSEDVDLFTPFSAAGEGAVGLGAWIVRHLVTAMDGTIEYRDGAPGACFVVRVPARSPAVAGQASATDSRSTSGTTAPVPRS